MLSGRDIICISSIDWDFIWQGHQEIMSTFAGNGNRVLFIENTGVRTPNIKDIGRLKKRLVNWFRSTRGFKEVSPNLYIYSPIMLPFPYSRLARLINRYLLINPIKQWMKAMDFHNPVIWTFLPTNTALDIITHIEHQLLVYYCIADFYTLNDPKKIRRAENELIRKSDVIFVQGEVLKDRCAQLNANVHIFPFGVDDKTFSDQNVDEGNIPGDIRSIKGPIVGYVGGIHRHMDFGLLKAMATEHPEWSIVLVGPLQTDVSLLNALPNVFMLGKKDFSLLPGYIKKFDVCIIPYEINNYTATVFPTKLNEYHAMGKPVISTELPEIVNFNRNNGDIVFIAKNRSAFISHVLQAIKADDNIAVNKRVESTKQHSWSARIEKMSDIMEEAITGKANDVKDWKKAFLNFYQVSRKRLVKIACVILGLYILVFHTPVMWLIAEPLKISQPLRDADCIVVLGGGVGESGKAGQGYQERVDYGVELYKEGYAGHLIFSSGYIHVFKETLIMKALAVSLGVPSGAILLEDKARNTFENIKFASEILDKNGWNRIILVSSPYHMRRASLVFNKNFKNIKVTYAPLPHSAFYSHFTTSIFERQITVKQIRGILNEYLGIIYYLLKGWA